MADTRRTARPNALTALRYENEGRILEALMKSETGLTQRQISEGTGLARNTVSALLSERLADFVEAHTLDTGGRGAPPKLFSMRPDAALALGVDIGKTHVTVLLVDATGGPVRPPVTRRLSTILGKPKRTLDLAGEMIAEQIGNRDRCELVAGVMVGLPGATDAASGHLMDPEAPRWEQTSVFGEIASRWPGDQTPEAMVDNDANLGALGELHRGAGRDVDSLVFIKWSTGIGAGIVLDGELWRGKSGIAGELGHLPVNPRRQERVALRLPPRDIAEPCPRCGQIRCLESIAGGPALAGAFGVKDFRALLDLAAGLDDVRSLEARKGLEAAARLIGTAIGPTLTILNVEKVIVGGIGGVDGLPYLHESIEEGIEATTASRIRADAEICAAELGDKAYAWGAALTALAHSGPDFVLSQAAG